MSKVKTPWLEIIGIGEDGTNGLSPLALELLKQAEFVIGGQRHHELATDIKAERLVWPSPFDAMIDTIVSHRGRRVVVLVTGDPLWFSAGARIGRAFRQRKIPLDELRFHPQLSSFQWAACRLGWSLADCEQLTIHGRPAEQVIPCFAPGIKLLVLTKDGNSPKEVAKLLCRHGYGQSKLHVLAHLGRKKESRLEGIAKNWRKKAPDFHVLAIECIVDENALFSRLGGLDDDCYDHDGQLTKHTIRAATIAALRPFPDALLWDVGAGSGSVAIEWMRAARGARAIAIEPNKSRIKRIETNARKLGAPGLEIIAGKAPETFDKIDHEKSGSPDAIFIGGGLNTPKLFETVWKLLRPGGRLVANVVTLEGEQKLFLLYRRYGGRLERIAVSTLAPLGKNEKFSGFKPAMNVTQWVVVKPFKKGKGK